MKFKYIGNQGISETFVGSEPIESDATIEIIRLWGEILFGITKDKDFESS